MVCKCCSCKDISCIYCRTIERMVAIGIMEICIYLYFYGDFVCGSSVKKYLAFGVNSFKWGIKNFLYQDSS